MLTQSPEGQRYIRLYYQHAREVSWLRRRHPDLRLQAHDALEQILPLLDDAVNGYSAALSAATMAAIEGVLDAIAAKASPRLRWTIRRLQSDLRRGTLLTLFGIEVDTAR